MMMKNLREFQLFEEVIVRYHLRIRRNKLMDCGYFLFFFFFDKNIVIDKAAVINIGWESFCALRDIVTCGPNADDSIYSVLLLSLPRL